MAPDINVLLAAFRSDHVHHGQAHAWLTSVIEVCALGETFEILPMVAAGFLRLATHPKVFVEPAPTESALEFLRTLFAHGATMPELGPEWPSFERLCLDQSLIGNQIPDAWIAAAITTGGYHLVTFDKDFRKLLRLSEFTLLRP